MLDLMLNGRVAMVLLEFYPHEKLTAPEVWKRRQGADESDGKLRTFLSLSCGATYAAVGTCLQHGLLQETTPSGSGTRRYRLTDRGRTVAFDIAKELRTVLARVSDPPMIPGTARA